MVDPAPARQGLGRWPRVAADLACQTVPRALADTLPGRGPAGLTRLAAPPPAGLPGRPGCPDRRPCNADTFRGAEHLPPRPGRQRDRGICRYLRRLAHRPASGCEHLPAYPLARHSPERTPGVVMKVSALHAGRALRPGQPGRPGRPPAAVGSCRAGQGDRPSAR